MIVVAHVHDKSEFAGPTVYVGRGGRGRKGSPLGNPFKIGRDGSRAEVIAKYRAWLDARLAYTLGEQNVELDRLITLVRERGALRVLCFCKPDDCHGDVIAEKIMERVG
jgi:hypothetical protein